MRCPNDQEPLLVLEFEGIEIDYCDKCRGIWLDPEEMTLLLGADAGWEQWLKPQRDDALARVKKRCPRCGTRMLQRPAGKSSPVNCDLCPRGHGLWLDAGELHALVSQGGADPALQRLAQWLATVFAAQLAP